MTASIVGCTFDCHDAVALAKFWSDLLGWDVVPWSDSSGAAIAYRAEPGFWLGFAAVPEEKVAKNRFHLDLEAEDLADEIARAEALGAKTLAEHREHFWTWTVLADPEGNEFCLGHPITDEASPWTPVGGRARPPAGSGTRIGGTSFDCADPTRVSVFWAELLGSSTTRTLADGALISPALGSWTWFASVPEPKAAKNRFHPDLEADDYLAEVAWAETLGARTLAEHREAFWDWNVMADPEGNEFCLGRTRPALADAGAP
jgi:predicted enzyme related to lactoylglutathione lyase